MKRLVIFVGAVMLVILGSLALAVFGTTITTSAAQPASLAASLGSAPTLTASPSPSATCAPSWAVVTTENVLSQEGAQFVSVDSASSSDVWSVGAYETSGTSRRKTTPITMPGAPSDHKGSSPSSGPYVDRTLVEHWDGTTWSIVASPNMYDDNNQLYQVSTVTADDVWAVGYFVNTIGVAQTLTEHWDGTTWTIVTSPNTTNIQDNQLSSVEALASNDVWAAGYASDDIGRVATLIEHWNGTAWSIVASPNASPDDNSLADLAAISPNDIWAVGAYMNEAGNNRIAHTLALHWDGTTWSVIPTQAVGTGYNSFTSIDGAASNDIWAVGSFSSTTGGPRILMEHWDGTTWNVIAPPNLGQAYGSLYSIDALTTSDVWAVGSVTPYSNYSSQGLSLHWDGSTWSIVKGVLANYATQRNFRGVVAVAPLDVWAVGSTDYYYGDTLAEHYSTACVTCNLSFTDVPADNPFYASILCLACQGIVNGYVVYPAPIPTSPPGSSTPHTPVPTSNPFATDTPFPTPQSAFHPNFNVTRGQLAKIVSNSAGFDENPVEQVFEDIPQYNPFYVWVNRLSRRGILTGYPCGGPGEPCGQDNLPYFRPANNATRGQTSKMDAKALLPDCYIP